MGAARVAPISFELGSPSVVTLRLTQPEICKALESATTQPLGGVGVVVVVVHAGLLGD